jgi:hypothetical protein
MTRFGHTVHVCLTTGTDDVLMPAPIIHRVQVALDCECGTTVEACDGEELLDELLEHIAAAHEAGLRREPAAMLADAFEA